MAGKKEVDKASAGPDAAGPTDSSEDKPIMMIRNISKSYRKKLVLRDVNFEVHPGDVFGLIGMSGSGKTTIFHMMSGTLKAEAGDVLVRRDILFSDNNKGRKDKKDFPDFVSVFRNQNRVKRNFGFATQTPSFYEHLTVEENLFMYGALYCMKRKKVEENTKYLLKLVDLEAERDTISSELSGGMQRRLDIACSLIHEPKVLFLDEPTSDLDPVMRKQIWSLIKEINGKGTTIVLASHILEEVENLCSKVAILHDRKILGYGTLKELKRLFRRNQQVEVEFESGDYSALMKRIRRIKGVEKVFEKDSRLVVFAPPGDKAVREVIKAVDSVKERLVSLDVADATLNDIFEALMEKD